MRPMPFSPEAYARFGGLVTGTLIYDPGAVEPGRDGARRRLALPAAEVAERELSSRLFANAVFLGAACRVLEGVLEADRVLEAMAERIPRFPAENRRAFERGWELGGPERMSGRPPG